MALTEKLKNIADTIRAKTGGTDPLTLDQMAVEIAGISMGDTSVEDGLLDGTFAAESYTNNRITQLRTNALSGFSNLKSFTGTNVKKVLTYSFQNAGIETVHLPSAEMIASRAFQGCASLESISLPSLTTSTAHSTLFLNCKKLKDVHLPNMLCAKTAMFNACTSLEEISLPSVISIEANVFLEATALKKVILKHSEVVSLANVNAFDKTPFASGGTGGTVYVPQALIESYQNATNWSTLYAAGTCNFVAIEGSEYE